MDKRRVTMRSITLMMDGTTAEQVATDYVPEDILEAYVIDARTRWQHVAVSEEVDFGPGGPDGDTSTPDHLEV